MGPPTFSQAHLFFLLLIPCFLSISSFSSTAARITPTLHPKANANHSATTLTEKLIRQLNLFPEEPVNIATHGGGGGGDDDNAASSSAPKLVEKCLNLHIIGHSRESVADLGHHAGYYRLPHTHAARMFYFFFESRSSKADPVVIWLTGGPGCGSEVALFYENGPFHIANNLSLVWNDYGWDTASNIIFVDQPTGTGFSYSSDDNDIRHDEVGVSNDLYDFLQAFFVAHPQYVKNDFYITGESYAGHYIPALASRVYKGNQAKEGIHINLKGFAIGNGLTNPAIQYPAYTDYALDMKLITQSDHDCLNKMLPSCEEAINQCGTAGEDACTNAFSICDNFFSSILEITGNINYYDIRKTCEGSHCYDFSNMEKFLNKKAVRDALGVGDIEFVSCSRAVYEAMLQDWMKNFEVGIPALLENGTRVLIYAGEYDLICNWLGNSKWVNAINWSGQKEFGAAPTVPFLVDGAEAGLVKSHGPLTFLKVHNAGHMVPMDQPKAALQMLKSWMSGKVSVESTINGIAPS